MFHNKKTLLLTALGVLVIAGGAVALVKSSVFDSAADKQQKSVTQQSNSKKDAVVSHNGNQSTQSSDGKSTATDSTYTPPADSGGITLTASQSDNQVTIMTKLSGYSDGTCSLTVTNGSQTTTKTADVVYAPEFSTCAGFSVPVQPLGTGTWNISLSVTSGGKTNTKTTTFGVK